MTTYHDSTSIEVGSSTALSIAKPTLSDNDWVYIFFYMRGNNSITAPPTGFSPVTGSVNFWTSTNSSGVRVEVFRKFIATAGSEPANYTATSSVNLNGGIIAVSVSGADVSAPPQDIEWLADTDVNANVSAPDATSTSSNALVLRFMAMNVDLGITSWASADCTEVEDVSAFAATDRVGAFLGWETQASPGAVGTATATATLGSGSTYGFAAGLTIIIGATTPVAAAGSDQTVNPGQLVTLDGGASTGGTDFLWTQTAGTPDIEAYLINADAEECTFYAPAPAGESPVTLTFQLEYTGGVDSDTDTVAITINPLSTTLPSGPSLGIGLLGADGLVV